MQKDTQINTYLITQRKTAW